MSEAMNTVNMRTRHDCSLTSVAVCVVDFVLKHVRCQQFGISVSHPANFIWNKILVSYNTKMNVFSESLFVSFISCKIYIEVYL